MEKRLDEARAEIDEVRRRESLSLFIYLFIYVYLLIFWCFWLIFVCSNLGKA